MRANYIELIAERTVWVSELDEAVVGALVFREAVDHLMIDNIAVDPPLQGIGIGTELLAFAEHRARTHGLAQVRLYTNETMIENLDYYFRRGYAETGRRTDAGFSRVYFSKTVINA